MEQIEKHLIPLYDYSDVDSSLYVLMGRNGVDYIDYDVVKMLYEQSEEENPYRTVN